MILTDEQLDDLRQKGIIDSDYSMGDAIETAKALRAEVERLRSTTKPQGCICPPTSEQTCKSALCPRQFIYRD